MSLESHKSLVRRLFEEVFAAGDVAAVGALVAEDTVDHNPMPGQPAGVEGIEYVVETLHTAHPDLRFTVDDLVARPRHKRVERWVVNAVWDEEGRREVAELFDPVRLERLDQAVGGHLDDIARHTHRGHRVIIKRVMVDA